MADNGKNDGIPPVAPATGRRRITAETLAATMAQNMEVPPTSITPDRALGVDLGEEFMLIPINQIDPSPYQPRLQFPEKDIEELAESVRVDKLNQPISVRRKDGGRYELIAGERRILAFRKLGEPMIPAIIRHVDVRTAARSTISENLQRKDLWDIETALALQRALDDGIEETISGLSRLSGYDRSDVRRFLDMLKLPPEAIALLRTNPGLLSRVGAECICNFLESIQGGGEHRSNLVLKALEQIEARIIPQTRIAEWLRGAWRDIQAGDANSKAGSDGATPAGAGGVQSARARKVPLFSSSGESLGYVKHGGDQITIKITDPEKMALVKSAIAKAVGADI